MMLVGCTSTHAHVLSILDFYHSMQPHPTSIILFLGKKQMKNISALKDENVSQSPTTRNVKGETASWKQVKRENWALVRLNRLIHLEVDHISYLSALGK